MEAKTRARRDGSSEEEGDVKEVVESIFGGRNDADDGGKDDDVDDEE